MRLQRGYPTKISSRLGQERHSVQTVSFHLVDAVQAELKKAGMETKRGTAGMADMRLPRKTCSLWLLGKGFLTIAQAQETSLRCFSSKSVQPPTVSQLKPRDNFLWFTTKPTLARRQSTILRLARHSSDDQNVVEVVDAPHPLGIKEGLKRFCHTRED